MTASWFLYYEGECLDPAAFADAFAARFAEPMAALPGLKAARLYTRALYNDPMLGDEIGPALMARLSFADAAGALAAVSDWPAGPDLAAFGGPPDFVGQTRHELATDDRYPVEGDGTMTSPPGAVSYFVIYQGPAPDVDAFRRYYHTNHPPLLGKLPGARATILYTPTTDQPALPISNAGHMHICDISFDSVDALNTALQSDVRIELREDYRKFPPFDGSVTHQAMAMREIATVG